MWTRRTGHWISAFAALIASPAYAVDINSIDPGDVYYIYQLVGENTPVQVVNVDKSSNTVKIRYTNGAVDWIAPEKLLTQAQSDNADVATNVGAAAIGIGIVACMLDPESCKEK